MFFKSCDHIKSSVLQIKRKVEFFSKEDMKESLSHLQELTVSAFDNLKEIKINYLNEFNDYENILTEVCLLADDVWKGIEVKKFMEKFSEIISKCKIIKQKIKSTIKNPFYLNELLKPTREIFILLIQILLKKFTFISQTRDAIKEDLFKYLRFFNSIYLQEQLEIANIFIQTANDTLYDNTEKLKGFLVSMENFLKAKEELKIFGKKYYNSLSFELNEKVKKNQESIFIKDLYYIWKLIILIKVCNVDNIYIAFGHIIDCFYEEE
jgi:hypothetical protein